MLNELPILKMLLVIKMFIIFSVKDCCGDVLAASYDKCFQEK